MIKSTFTCELCGVSEDAFFLKAFNELIPADEYSEGVMETWSYLEAGEETLICPVCSGAKARMPEVFDNFDDEDFDDESYEDGLC